MYILIDVQVTPLHPPEDIREEIKRVRELGDTPEVDKTVAMLEEWLEDAERHHK